jgi:hypothetical protein
MPLKRTPHWDTREFHDWIAAHAGDPFVWGTNDCCLVAANAILSFTGTDLAVDFRGKYTDQKTALALIHTVTGGTAVADAAAWCATKAGLVAWAHPLLAQRGDLVVVNSSSEDGTEMAGVIHLDGRSVITVGAKGLLRVPCSSITKAWKV